MSDDSQLLKLSYNTKQRRVVIRIVSSYCLSHPEVPSDILDRARKKMAVEIEKGEVKEFILHDHELSEVWSRIIKLLAEKKLHPQHPIEFILATGLVNIEGIHLADAEGKNHLALLTVEASKEQIQQLREKGFGELIKKLLKEKGVETPPQVGQLTAIYYKLIVGEKITGLGLRKSPSINDKPAEQDYTINYVNKDELVSCIFDFHSFLKKGAIEQYIQHIEKAIAKIPGEFSVHQTWIRSELTAAIQGKEILGLGVPRVLFLGQKKSQNFVEKRDAPETMIIRGSKEGDNKPQVVKKTPTAQAQDFPREYPGKGLLQVNISPDKSFASIIKFNLAYYNDKERKLDETWIKREVKRLKLIPAHGEFVERILYNIKRSRDLNSLKIVEGRLAEAPSDPQLVMMETLEDPEKKSKKERIIIVEKDQQVAHVVYNTPGEEGFDVYGKTIPIPEPEPYKVEIGDHVEERDENQFFATTTGLLHIEGNYISVTKTFVHKGDVNLSSGNIIFDGPIIIEGSVDTGAIVHSGNRINISGDIRSGQVICKGNLQVGGSIITSQKGMVRCQGNIECQFIENSIIYCLKELHVKKSIVSSHIHASGKIIVEDQDGLIAGGVIYARSSIDIANLGFPSGQITEVFLGKDWQIEKQITHTKERLEKFKSLLEKEKNELRELRRRDKAQTTQKHLDIIDNLQKRTEKLKKIVASLEERIDVVEQKSFTSKDARINVKKALQTTVCIHVHKKTLNIGVAMANTGVLAFKRGKSFFLDLEAEEEKAKEKARKEKEREKQKELEEAREQENAGK